MLSAGISFMSFLNLGTLRKHITNIFNESIIALA